MIFAVINMYWKSEQFLIVVHSVYNEYFIGLRFLNRKFKKNSFPTNRKLQQKHEFREKFQIKVFWVSIFPFYISSPEFYVSIFTLYRTKIQLFLWFYAFTGVRYTNHRNTYASMSTNICEVCKTHNRTHCKRLPNRVPRIYAYWFLCVGECSPWEHVICRCE